MSVVLAYETARTYWRLAAAGVARMPERVDVNPLIEAGGGVRRLRHEGLRDMRVSWGTLRQWGLILTEEGADGVPGGEPRDAGDLAEGVAAVQDAHVGYSLPRPIHVLVASPSARGAENPSQVKAHVCRYRLPRSSFCHIVNDVFIVSPELLYVQMCQVDRRLHAAAAFGCELAGAYALLPRGLERVRRLRSTAGADPDGADDAPLVRDGYVECAPQSSLQALRDFVDCLPSGFPGAKVARTALRWVRDGSRSPMETVSSVHLRMPRSYGGMGMGDGAFNVPVSLDESWQRALGKSYVVVDEHFVGRNGRVVDIEYNGAGGHTSYVRVASDNLRRHALEAKGHKVVSVTSRDFFDFETWGRVGEALTKYLGRYYSPPTRKMLERRRQVHADLADRSFLR